MIHPLEYAITAVLVAALAYTAVVLPRPKPVPPPPPPIEEQPPVERVVTNRPVIVIEQAKPKTDAERLRDLERKAESINTEQRQIIDQVKAITEDVKRK